MVQIFPPTVKMVAEAAHDARASKPVDSARFCYSTLPFQPAGCRYGHQVVEASCSCTTDSDYQVSSGL